MTTKPALQEILMGNSGKAKNDSMKAENTKAIKMNISVK